jgi:hypothetical protein
MFQVENLSVLQIKKYRCTYKKIGHFMANICAPAHPGPKKYNFAQIKYINEHLQTRKTFAQVICVSVYLCTC